MIRFAGGISGRYRHPYIYAIAKNYCLYIGETQLHPVIRWGQHMSTNGTFSTKLKCADEEIWMRNEQIHFLCIDCSEISLLSPEEHKLVTQYIEHKVHELCILNLPLLYPIEKIISDTTKTAPARCRVSWGDELAKRVYKELFERIKLLNLLVN